MYEIEMLPAFIGDALWVQYGDPARPHRMLIDGGLVGTTESIRSRIEAVAEKEGRCRLDLLVISHVDADHIEGIVKLLGDPDLPVDFDDIWFNGNRHLPDPDGSDEDEFLGGRQGEFLSALLETRGLPWNRLAGGGTIYAPGEHHGPLPRVRLRGGMELVVLSPTYDKLVKLSKRWDEEVRRAGLDGASLEVVLAALGRDRKLAPDDDFLSDEGPPSVPDLLEIGEKPDHSAANGSSIAFVASFDGKRCLFAADAHADALSANIARMTEAESGGRLAVDVCKLPHHGSAANITADLLRGLDCHRFLISTNGRRFHHPDRAAIARVVGGGWRGDDVGSDDPVDLLFNYRTDQSSVWADTHLENRWNYRTIFPEGTEPGLTVRL